IRFHLLVQANHFVAAPDVHATDNQRKDQNDSEDRIQYFHEETPSQNITSRIIPNKKSTTFATSMCLQAPVYFVGYYFDKLMVRVQRRLDGYLARFALPSPQIEDDREG